ncbi:MAG: hypothetical protein HYR94_00950 [Chloroflexi bacterium]|nr:hypothetical protein [Chloroflexota bacterium]
MLASLTQNPATVFSTLALQGLKTSGSDLNRALLRLSEIARRDPHTQKYLGDASADVKNSPPSAEFEAAFDQLLAEFGQRAIYETDMGWPRYADDPTPLINIIRRYTQSDLAGIPTAPKSGVRKAGWPSPPTFSG